MYETSYKFEDNKEMFAVEYLSLHHTENMREEDEPILFRVLELIDHNESLDKIIENLSTAEKNYLYMLLEKELKWCEEHLATVIEDPIVSMLKEAYIVAIEFINNFCEEIPKNVHLYKRT